MISRTWWPRESLQDRLDTAEVASSSSGIPPDGHTEWALRSVRPTCTRRISFPEQNLSAVWQRVRVRLQLLQTRCWCRQDCLLRGAEVPRRGPRSPRRCRSLSRFSIPRRPTGTRATVELMQNRYLHAQSLRTFTLLHCTLLHSHEANGMLHYSKYKQTLIDLLVKAISLLNFNMNFYSYEYCSRIFDASTLFNQTLLFKNVLTRTLFSL